MAELLREAGHNALTVNEQELRGSQDLDLARICENEGRVLVTLGIDFADLRLYPPENHLCQLLKRLGFNERIRGDHHIFTKSGVAEIINLQPKRNKAKAYQVKQARDLMLKYRLGGHDVD